MLYFIKSSAFWGFSHQSHTNQIRVWLIFADSDHRMADGDFLIEATLIAKSAFKIWVPEDDVRKMPLTFSNHFKLFLCRDLAWTVIISATVTRSPPQTTTICSSNILTIATIYGNVEITNCKKRLEAQLVMLSVKLFSFWLHHRRTNWRAQSREFNFYLVDSGVQVVDEKDDSRNIPNRQANNLCWYAYGNSQYYSGG